MAKHEKKEKNELLELIANPVPFMGLFVKDREDKAALAAEILNGGPKHKQVYSTLLANRMNVLVQTVKKISGEAFVVQKGSLLSSHKDDMDIAIPLVLASVNKDDKERIAEALSHAPAHEIIAFNALLQGIEWSINTLKKHVKEN